MPMKYRSLAELVEAYRRGVLTAESPLTVDNDTSYVYVADEQVYRGGGPHDLIGEALDLLGVPNEPA